MSDQDALWRALDDGTLQTVSSDHAPYAMDETGKLAQGANPNFKQIANGMPGLQMRLPMLFDAMVSQARFDLCRFVQLTSTAPAKIYNLHPTKGSIAPGCDADLVLWDPDRETEISHELTQDRAGYCPYVGRTIRGWPETVLLRGQVIVEGGTLTSEPGTGRFLARQGGRPAAPRGPMEPEFDRQKNFAAELV